MKLLNTLTREVEELKPAKDNAIKMYTCGLTVYSQPHIGNWVGYIYWDVLQRTLEANGYSVKRVQNYTDVGHLVSDDDSGEDKMEKGAKAEGSTAWQVAEKYIDIAENEGYEQLGLIRPKTARATDYINQQIEFVKKLEDKGFTYTIQEEGVYFDTSKLSDYGKLAKLDIEGLKEGARVDNVDRKNPTDFALWKFCPKNSKRDMEWDSPWGVGFPGWHLECSTIILELLGEEIDLHCGGIDHIPVHHTNEIAQSEALTGKQLSRFWVHNNHLKVDGKKMAKSLGNIYTLQDILDKGFSLDAFKLLVISKHYTTEGNFTWEILESAQNRLTNWQRQACVVHQASSASVANASYINFKDNVLDLLNSNLSTAEAVAIIGDTLDQASLGVSAEGSEALKNSLSEIEKLLGISLLKPDIDEELKSILSDRQKARDSSDWIKSDELRDQLTANGVGINDGPNGQTWYWM